jgi:RimJ/RimL family protein N-acetyltransferase
MAVATVQEVIRTPRLVLRDFEPSDLDGFARVLADPQAMAAWGGPFNAWQAERKLGRYIEHRKVHGFAPFAVLLDDEIIGDVGLQHLEDDEFDLQYRLLPSAWGQGFATEAADAALEHAFSELGRDEVVVVIADDNEASQRLAQRLGFARGKSRLYNGQPLIRFRITPDMHAEAMAARQARAVVS